MEQLTPELQLYSRFAIVSSGQSPNVDCESRELDFNLARRSGVVINSIESTLSVFPGAVEPNIWGVQEVDLDPDNDTLWTETCTGDDVEIDSSRLLIHSHGTYTLVVTDTSYTTPSESQLLQDWRQFAMVDRPISITNLRHHLCLCAGEAATVADGLICIRYMIVELSLNEIGYINASRR